MRIPVVMAVILLVMSITVDAYITLDIRKASPRRPWWKVYGLTAVLMWVWLTVIFCLPKRSEDSGILDIMWMLYTYLSVYLAKVCYALFSLLGRVVNLCTRRKTRGSWARWCGVAAALVVAAVMWAGVVYTRHHIVVNRVEVTSAKLPEAFNGYTIAQISDLHVGTWGNDTTFIANLVDSVNALHPELIVFTGDIVNRKTTELKPFLNVLSRLRAPGGVLSILGNHDYGDYVDWKTPEEHAANNRLLAQYEKQMGWDLLNNMRRVVYAGNDSIIVAGVENWGDPPFPVYGDLEKALPGSVDSTAHQNDSNFKILLTHNPEHWNQVVSHTTNVDLTLSGHTHAMQVMIGSGAKAWSPAVFRYPQWGGLYSRPNDRGEMTGIYVNIGAGEVGMPSRLLGAYPEITLITLRREP